MDVRKMMAILYGLGGLTTQFGSSGMATTMRGLSLNTQSKYSKGQLRSARPKASGAAAAKRAATKRNNIRKHK